MSLNLHFQWCSFFYSYSSFLCSQQTIISAERVCYVLPEASSQAPCFAQPCYTYLNQHIKMDTIFTMGCRLTWEWRNANARPEMSFSGQVWVSRLKIVPNLFTPSEKQPKGTTPATSHLITPLGENSCGLVWIKWKTLSHYCRLLLKLYRSWLPERQHNKWKGHRALQISVCMTLDPRYPDHK